MNKFVKIIVLIILADVSTMVAQAMATYKTIADKQTDSYLANASSEHKSDGKKPEVSQTFEVSNNNEKLS